MDNCTVGQVVVFKSGGPEMTVTDVAPDGTATCMWFYEGEVSEDKFNPLFLEPVYDEDDAAA